MNNSQSVAGKIKACSVVTEPYKHAEINNFLPDTMYKEYLTSIIPLEYFLPLKRINTIKNGIPTRFEMQLNSNVISKLELTNNTKKFWQELLNILTSKEFINVLKTKLGVIHDVTPSVVLYRDFGGFRLEPHTDIVEKKITFGLYLPSDTSQRSLGFNIISKNDDAEFVIVKTVEYTPNKALFFRVSESSWHNAENSNEGFERNSLFVHFYGTEYVKNNKIVFTDKNVDRQVELSVS